MKRERPLFRLLTLLVANAHGVCVALIVASVLGLLAIPLLDRPIRFDEKGLLAGLAHPTIGAAAGAVLPDALRIAHTAGGASAFQRPGAAAALAAELRRAGLAGTQVTRPTVTAPGPTPGAAPSACRCANVHTVVRSRRGDGLESLAMVTPVAFSPQRPDPAFDGRNQSAGGAELALLAGASLALHLARGTGGGGGRWMARDLVWVVPDMSCGAHQCLTAWVQQYHEQGQGAGMQAPPQASEGAGPPAGALVVRGGVIQQAVVLEALAGASYDTPEVLVIGHDGLLPKLDMYFLLRYIFNYPVSTTLWRDDRLAAAQRATSDWLERLLPGLLPAKAVRSYVGRLLTGLQFAWHQAVGQPAGAHAAFKNHMVDAATVRLVQRDPQRPWLPSAGDLERRALSVASSLELSLRSLNNLVERVHHSSFLYLITQLDRYVPVEVYVGPAVALTAALQLQAAWSMRCAQQALEGPPAANTPAGIWAVALSRVAARTGVLAAAAAALRSLACSPPGAGPAAPGAASWAAPPGWADAVTAARGLMRRQLSAAEAALVAAAVLLATAGAATAAASLVGRLASAAAGGAPGAAGGAGGLGDEQRDEQQQKGQEESRQRLRARKWHAERVVVLTLTAVAMTVLVCLNWAAAVVAGAYMAPLALGQGWLAARAQPKVDGQETGGQSHAAGMRVRAARVLGPAAWVALTPLIALCTAAMVLSRIGFGGAEASKFGTPAHGVCQLSTTNYWYAQVVVLAFWLFGLEGSFLRD